MTLHIFELGRHIAEEFEVEASVQDIINVVYFTGGPTAGTNLLKLYSDSDSLSTYRRGMERIGDNRVVTANQESADQLSETLIAENNTEVFSATVEIDSSSYDVTTINIGDLVGFAGFTNFVNSLRLNVVTKRRVDFGIRLRLGRVPYKSTNNNALLTRQVGQLQTLDNPDSPS